MRKKERGRREHRPSTPPPPSAPYLPPQRISMPPPNGEPAQGVLELHPKGYGFLRNPARNYVAQPADPYVGAPLIQKFRLREGLLLTGPTEPARKGSSGPRLARIDSVEGKPPDQYRPRNF